MCGASTNDDTTARLYVLCQFHSEPSGLASGLSILISAGTLAEALAGVPAACRSATTDESHMLHWRMLHGRSTTSNTHGFVRGSATHQQSTFPAGLWGNSLGLLSPPVTAAAVASSGALIAMSNADPTAFPA